MYLSREDLPAPTEDYLNFTFEESVQCPVFVNFTGGRQNRPYAFSWQNSNNHTICSTAGVTNTFGRYTCGWTVNDRETCNHIVWLVIHNCSSTDAGNYTIRITDGQPAHVLLCKLGYIIIIIQMYNDYISLLYDNTCLINDSIIMHSIIVYITDIMALYCSIPEK